MMGNSTKISIRFFNDKEVRAIWDEENSKWWFSVPDSLDAKSKTKAYALFESSLLDSNKIKSLVKNALTDKINDREMFMKGIDYSYYYEEAE